MWTGTLTDIQRDLNRWRTDHPGITGTVGHRPARVALNPVEWREMVADLKRDQYTLRDERAVVATLFGMRVIEDPTLEPGAWRLEA